MIEPQYQTSASIARNVFFGLSTWILPLALGFLATPVIVRSLGNEDYGVYALVLGFVGYSFSFSIGRTLVKYVAEYRINGETEKINDIVSATLIVNIIVGFVGVLLLIGLADWYAADISKLVGESRIKAVHALYIAAVIVFVTMTSQVFDGILQGLHRYDLYSKIFNLNGILLTSGNLLLAWLGYGLHSLLLWNVVVSLITLTAYTFSSIKLLPHFRINFGTARENYRLVVDFSYGLVGYQIISNFLLLFERAWLSRKLGVESVTFYVVPMTMGLYIHGLTSSILMVVFPLASELRDDKQKLLRLYQKSTKIAAVIVLFIALSLIVESKLFLTLWIGSEFAERSSVLLIMHTIAFSLLAIVIVAWRVAEGLGHTAYNFLIYSACFVLTMVLTVMLTPKYGMEGVAMARVAGFVLMFLSIFYLEHWVFGGIQWKMWVGIILKLGVAAVVAGFTQIAINNYISSTWLSFIFAIAVSATSYLAVLLILKFPDAEDIALVKTLIGKYRNR